MTTTFLQATNNVLLRLREAEVTTVTENAYSKLIARLVNDSKRTVEDAWNWNALYTTITLTTSASTHTYTLTGSGYRFKIDTVNNTTNTGRLTNVPLSYILDQQQLTTAQTGQPRYYAIKGMSGADAQVVLYPTPDGTASIKFNGWVPQVDLVLSADILVIPSEAVILGAYARALAERGEDGGLSSSEAHGLYKLAMADQIAIESTRHAENDAWESV